MLTEQQLRDALTAQLPQGAEIDGFFKVDDAHGRIRMGATTKASMNGDDLGWYAEVSNFRVDRDYCDPEEGVEGLYRFFCEVERDTLAAYYLSASIDAREALDAVCEPSV
jgi:hypothetical protein